MSFGHKAVKLNMESKTFFTKIAQFGMLLENITEKVKVKLSFSHKAVILSLSKLNIRAKTVLQ